MTTRALMGKYHDWFIRKNTGKAAGEKWTLTLGMSVGSLADDTQMNASAGYYSNGGTAAVSSQPLILMNYLSDGTIRAVTASPTPPNSTRQTVLTDGSPNGMARRRAAPLASSTSKPQRSSWCARARHDDQIFRPIPLPLLRVARSAGGVTPPEGPGVAQISFPSLHGLLPREPGPYARLPAARTP